MPYDGVNIKANLDEAPSFQGGFKNLQNCSRPRQSAHFSSIIGVLAPTAVGDYDFLKPPCIRPRADSRTCKIVAVHGRQRTFP